MFWDICGRVDESYSTCCKFIGDRAEQHVTSSIEPQASIVKQSGTKIGQLAKNSKRLVHPRFANSPNHYGFLDFCPPKNSDPFADLQHSSSGKDIAVVWKGSIKLIAKADAHHFSTSGANSICNQDRKHSAACDHSDLHWKYMFAVHRSCPFILAVRALEEKSLGRVSLQRSLSWQYAIAWQAYEDPIPSTSVHELHCEQIHDRLHG